MTLTCEQSAELLTDLLAGEITPDSAEALDAHLAGCEPCRQQAARALRLDRALAELSAQQQRQEIEAAICQTLAGARPQANPATRPVRRRILGAILGLAAAIALAVGAAYWFGSSPERAIAQVGPVLGEVYLIEGESRAAVSEGQPIRTGQGIQTVGEESGVTLVFPDATRIDIGPESTVQELIDTEGSGKRVFLTEGYLRADVAKQPAGKPMVLVTPHAQVVVKGTTLSLVNSAEATRVDLEEGKVEVTRRSDGERVEVAAGNYSIVRAGPEPIAPRPLPPLVTRPRLLLAENSTRVLCQAFAPDGRTMATGGRDGVVRLWDPHGNADQQPISFQAHRPDNEVRALIYSPKGLLLASGGDEDQQTRLWSATDLRKAATLKGLRTWIETLAFTPDGQTFIVAGAHGQDSARIKVWDLASFRVRHTLTAHAGGVWCVALSPDTQLLATAGRDGTVKLWGLATGQLLLNLEGHVGESLCVAISPDGKTIASGGRDKTVKLWDVASGEEIITLLGHAHDVRALAFTRDGRFLISGSMDSTARLWDLTDYRERTVFRGSGGIWSIALSPDGRTLATAGNSKSVRLWDLP